MEEALPFNEFFFRSSIYALIAKIQPGKVVQWCQDGNFLCAVFSASRVQYISDLKGRKKQDKNIMCMSAMQGGDNYVVLTIYD